MGCFKLRTYPPVVVELDCLTVVFLIFYLYFRKLARDDLDTFDCTDHACSSVSWLDAYTVSTIMGTSVRNAQAKASVHMIDKERRVRTAVLLLLVYTVSSTVDTSVKNAQAKAYVNTVE